MLSQAGTQAITPLIGAREAFLAPTRVVPWRQAAGSVSAELVTCYPPGIPVLMPGEVVSRELVDYLSAALRLGVHLQGPADPTLGHLRVVA